MTTTRNSHLIGGWMHSEDGTWSPLNVSKIYEHWTMHWKYLKSKRRRPSTKMVVAMNNESIEQCIENIWKKKSDDHQLRWSSPKIFFPKYFEKYPRKKMRKKKSNTRLSASVAQALFFSLTTSDERTNRRSKAYSQRIAAENCSNDHNTPIFN